MGWGVPAIHLAATFDRRWIPHDEGTLAQPAWRILMGEVPHRDFDALYTGLLDYVHAGAMALLGTHLLALRVVLLVAALAWLATVWSLARRFLPPPAAALATVLAGALGPVNYPAAMPSWYNLFLATWGLWAVVRWTEERRSRWLLLAGACAGLSMAVKIAGLYLLAGVLFAVLHVALHGPGPGDAEGSGREGGGRPGGKGGGRPGGEGGRAGGGVPGRSPWPAAGVCALLAALLAMEAALVRSQWGPAALTHYVLPTLALAAVAARRAWRPEPVGGGAAVGVVRGWAVALAGVAAVVVPFAAAFAAAGALDDLFRGVFVLPRLRFERAAGAPPPLASNLGVLVPVGLLAASAFLGRRGRVALASLVAVAGAALAVRAAGGDFDVYRPAWLSLTLLVPVAVVTGAVVLARAPPGPRRPAVLAVLWVAALAGLLQFPFSTPTYFVHVAPLGVLALAAAAREAAGADDAALRPAARPVATALAVVVVLFLAVGPNRWGLFEPHRLEDTVPLRLERARLRVPPAHAGEYRELVAAVRELSTGPWLYATADVPEVYFLSGLRNPTRTLFEIFDDEERRVARTLDALEEHDVNVVVINGLRRFSTVPPALVEELEERFPRAADIGRFRVRWR